MRRIYWDTMLYVYWFENNPRYVHRIEQIYTTMQRRADQLCSSSLAYAEVLVGPTSTNDLQAAAAVDRFFRSPELTVLPFSLEAAPIFASLRVLGLKPPDAMHVAIAAQAGVDLFLTNDTRLRKLSLPNLPFIASLDTDLF